MQPSIREAAVLLSCLPQRYAARVLSRLSPEDAQAIRQQLADLAQHSAAERAWILQRFLKDADQASSPKAHRRWDPPADALPSFHFLHPLRPAEIARLIEQELPRTQAVVLAQLAPSLAAEILAELSTERRAEVVQQLATVDGQAVPALPELARSLRQIIARGRSCPTGTTIGRQLLLRMLQEAQGRSHQLLRQALQDGGLVTGDAESAADAR